MICSSILQRNKRFTTLKHASGCNLAKDRIYIYISHLFALQKNTNCRQDVEYKNSVHRQDKYKNHRISILVVVGGRFETGSSTVNFAEKGDITHKNVLGKTITDQ